MANTKPSLRLIAFWHSDIESQIFVGDPPLGVEAFQSAQIAKEIYSKED